MTSQRSLRRRCRLAAVSREYLGHCQGHSRMSRKEGTRGGEENQVTDGDLGAVIL